MRICGLALFLAASLVFLVAWAVMKHDVQGATVVAAYVLAFAGASMGLLQAGGEMEVF